MRISLTIVDDEPLAVSRLQRLLQQDARARVVATYTDPERFIQEAPTLSCRAFYLDIAMPKRSGLDLAAMLPKPAAVVFTTAYPAKAVHAFQLDAVDYLVKPVDPARLYDSITRVDRYLRSQETAASDSNADLMIKVGARTKRISFADILWIEAQGNYCIVHTQRGEFAHRQSLEQLHRELPQPAFQRCHRSAVVNTRMIESYCKEGSAKKAILFNHDAVPVSRRFARKTGI
jgi:two-component system LytT family response regulator